MFLGERRVPGEEEEEEGFWREEEEFLVGVPWEVWCVSSGPSGRERRGVRGCFWGCVEDVLGSLRGRGEDGGSRREEEGPREREVPERREESCRRGGRGRGPPAGSSGRFSGGVVLGGYLWLVLTEMSGFAPYGILALHGLLSKMFGFTPYLF